MLAAEDDGVGPAVRRGRARRRAARRRAFARPRVPARRPTTPWPAAPRRAPCRCCVDTAEVADGPQRLEVTVEDGAGRVTRLVDRSILDRQHPDPVAVDGHADAGLGLLAAGPAVHRRLRAARCPAGAPACADAAPVDRRSPSVRCASGTGSPCSRAGAATASRAASPAAAGGRRRPAAQGTVVEVRHLVRGRTVGKPALKARRDGRLYAWIAAGRLADVVFRIRAADGRIVRVRIPIRVAKGRR